MTSAAELMTSTVAGGDVTSHLQVTWSAEAAAEGAEPARRYWTLVLVVIPALTLFGNALVVLAVWREAALRTATNYFIAACAWEGSRGQADYFIVSLAVADIMVAVLVMPFAVYVEVCAAAAAITHTRHVFSKS